MSYTLQEFSAGEVLKSSQLNAMDKQIMKNTHVRNLLDNSDFRNPVNQRGLTTISAKGYMIDRWENAYGTETLTNDGLHVTSETATAYLSQYIATLHDGMYTLATSINGAIYTRIVQVSGQTVTTIDNSNANYGSGYLDLVYKTKGCFEFMIRVFAGYSITVPWAALYEGSYTAETLPPYVPKGYAAELAECMRYFYRMTVSGTSGEVNNIIGYGYWASATTLRVTIILPQVMRITPSVVMSGDGLTACINGSTGGTAVTALTSLWGLIGNNFTLAATSTGGTAGSVGWLRLNVNGVLDFVADL